MSSIYRRLPTPIKQMYVQFMVIHSVAISLNLAFMIAAKKEVLQVPLELLAGFALLSVLMTGVCIMRVFSFLSKTPTNPLPDQTTNE